MVDLESFEIIITRILSDLNKYKDETEKAEELLQSKDIDIIEYKTRLQDLQNQGVDIKSSMKRPITNRREDPLTTLQNDNNELIQGKIHLLKNYNDLLINYNALKEDYRKAELNILELKKSMKPKRVHGDKHKYHSSLTAPDTQNELLTEIKSRLKVKTNEEIFASIEKMFKILSAVPQMESFIKKICNIVLSTDKSGESQIDEVIPKLEKWKENSIATTEELNFYREIIENLQQMCGEREPRKLIENLEGPYYLAWKMRPFISVFVTLHNSI